MAKKTPKIIDKRLEELFRFKAECLRRNPDFWEDMQRLSNCFLRIRSNAKGSMNELIRIRRDLYKKYDVWIRYPLHYNDAERMWQLFDIFPIRVIPYKPKIDVLGTYAQFKKSEKRWLNIIKQRPEEDIKHILKDGRYLTLEIDTNRDIDPIMRYIKDCISNVKKEKKRYGLEVRYEASPHLKNYKRYFAVWDLVQQRQKVWPYNRIVFKLKADGWYKKQTERQAENLARQDYRTACKLIGVSVKGNRLISKKVQKPIIKLKGAQKHKKLFMEWEKKLTSEGLGLTESENKYYSPDGALRKKIKKDTAPPKENM